MLKIIIGCFLIMNFLGFFLMRHDKKKAIKHEYRVSERTLWLVAVLFGATGMMKGMNTFHHKSKHPQFKLGLPILALLEMAIFLYVVIQLS